MEIVFGAQIKRLNSLSGAERDSAAKRFKLENTYAHEQVLKLRNQEFAEKEKTRPKREFDTLPIRGLDLLAKNEITGRPLAEPPIFNYDSFARQYVPSDMRFQLLFPDRKDIGKLTAFKDAWIESHMINLYQKWAGMMDDEHERFGSPKHDFYYTLDALLILDRVDAEEEWQALLDKTNDKSTLAWWEFIHLDDDLGTKGIEEKLAKDDIIFSPVQWEAAAEARKKYQHLFPDGVDENHKTYWTRKGELKIEEERKWEEDYEAFKKEKEKEKQHQEEEGHKSE